MPGLQRGVKSQAAPPDKFNHQGLRDDCHLPATVRLTGGYAQGAIMRLTVESEYVEPTITPTQVTSQTLEYVDSTIDLVKLVRTRAGRLFLRQTLQASLSVV